MQTSNTLSIGVANLDFKEAIKTFMQDQDHFSPTLSLRAWLNPNSELDVTYVLEGDDTSLTKASSGI